MLDNDEHDESPHKCGAHDEAWRLAVEEKRALGPASSLYGDFQPCSREKERKEEEASGPKRPRTELKYFLVCSRQQTYLPRAKIFFHFITDLSR